MTPTALIELLELFLGIIVLLWFFHGPWQSLLVDMTRQRIFEIRDNLFLYAADGNMDFDSEEYRTVRDYLNNSIRICHRISLISMAASNSMGKYNRSKEKTKTEPMRDIINSIENINVRNKIQSLLNETAAYIALLIILRSIFMMILLLILAPFALIQILLKGSVQQLMSRAISFIERDIKMGDT